MFKAIIPSVSSGRKKFSALTYGQIARVVSPLYNGDVVMCVGRDTVISLSRVGPGQSWSGIAYNDLDVELLPVGTKITLEVTE
jgi:hypothetical protein